MRQLARVAELALLAAFLLIPLSGCGEGTSSTAAVQPARISTIELTTEWAMVSADAVPDSGPTVSQPGYDVHTWYPVTVPSTILAGLVANGVYNDLYVGTNLQLVPDLSTQDWWYRGEFTAAPGLPDQQYWLRFKGIAYRAQIWLNGTLLDDNAVGTLVNHDYNVTGDIHPGAVNVLAVRVTPPSSKGDNLSFWYVDWNLKPPDMNGGIWGKVLLETTGPVALRDPYVQTVLPLPQTNTADLTIYVDAVNGSSAPVAGVLSGTITKSGHPTIVVSQSVTLGANERREIAFDPARLSQLHVPNPDLWWPLNMGNPDLYNLTLTLTIDGQPSDVRSIRFGIRQITEYQTPAIYGRHYLGYQINGQNVLIRGADYVWDLLMRWDSAINRAHMQYVKDMGLNAVRFEGILGNEEIYDLADEYGILLMPGYVCCTYWAAFDRWTSEDRLTANASLDSQMRLLRAHASAWVWAYGSDELPSHDVLDGYDAIAAALHWQNPTLDNVSSATNHGGSVPKMNGPYQWEPPVYWYVDTRGGAFGFCAEQGVAAVPPEESLRKFLPAADLWPIDDTWNYHMGGPPYDTLDDYSRAIDKRYGPASGLSVYAAKAQLLNYEAVRAQFEAYGANAHTLAQGTIYWMLNSAWPSLLWNLYDYYFKPGGSYFGAKKALEPVHVLWDYNTGDVKVFNATLIDANDLTAVAEVYTIPDLALRYSYALTTDFPANLSTLAFTLPPIHGLTPAYFLRLQLKDSSGALVSNNLYWYSTSPDVLSRIPSFFFTPVQSYADLTGLNSLQVNASVSVSAAREASGGTDTVRITLENRDGAALAFFLRAEVTAGNGGLEVLPITYTDNYVTLWPGERTTISATYAIADLGGAPPYLRLQGYNTLPISVPVT